MRHCSRWCVCGLVTTEGVGESSDRRAYAEQRGLSLVADGVIPALTPSLVGVTEVMLSWGRCPTALKELSACSATRSDTATLPLLAGGRSASSTCGLAATNPRVDPGCEGRLVAQSLSQPAQLPI